MITVANDRVDYLQLEIDRLAMGRAGMPVDTLQDALRSQVEGVNAGIVAVGLRRVPIVIRGDAAQASSPEVFAGQTLRSPDGQLLRVADVASLNRTEGPVKLEHENGSRFALVQAFVSGRDLVGYVEEAKADVAKTVTLPP